MIPAVQPARARTDAGAHLLVAALLAATTLALFWPGIVEYDTVAQYRQVLSGQYDDWHPPIMARLWSWLHPLAPGAAPLLVVQVVGYWTGLGTLAAALAVSGRGRRATATLALGALPLFLGWQGVVLKDAQMIGAALGATGIVAGHQLRERRMPPLVVAAAAALFGYALLVRANAVFALAPLIASLLPIRGAAGRIIATIALVALVLGVSGTINHRLLGAAASGVEKTQPLYDLAGIAARADSITATGLAPHDAAMLRARGCVSPFFWDPLGEPNRCALPVARLQALPAAKLYPMLAVAALHHPVAYAEQRLAHWNVTERWLVPAHLPGAAPSATGEPNDIGLRRAGVPAAWWQQLAGALADTPLGWPIAWLAAALALAWLTLTTPSPPAAADQARRRLALGLLASAIALETSFLFVSIAADLRYHLWPMIATGLAAIVLPRVRVTRRRIVGSVLVAAAVLLPGLAARAILPTPPQDYQAMLGWRFGAIALLPS